MGIQKLWRIYWTYVHNTETPILSYNNETELSVVVNLVIFAVRGMQTQKRDFKQKKIFKNQSKLQKKRLSSLLNDNF